MPHPRIDLTLPCVVNEIETALDEYPEFPYQIAFSFQSLRQKLISHILDEIPNHYRVEDDSKTLSHSRLSYASSFERQIKLEMIVHGSILHILRENSEWLVNNISALQQVMQVSLPG